MNSLMRFGAACAAAILILAPAGGTVAGAAPLVVPDSSASPPAPPDVSAGADTSAYALPPGRSLTLAEATAMALRKNEGLRSDRAGVAAAEAGVMRAAGAYDPTLEVNGGWEKVRQPSNSVYAGTASGASPTTEGKEADLALRQLLPTGGAVSIRGRMDRSLNDGSYILLSPAYDTQVGVELRQPLLRNLSVDAARFTKRAAVADRERARATLRANLTDTVAGVEDAYWGLVAARRKVEVLAQSVELAREQLQETESRVESNLLPATEPAQPRAELERRRGELLAAREALSRAENDLKLLILGDDDPLWLQEFVPTDEASVSEAPVDTLSLVTRALAQRPEVGVARSVVDRRRVEAAFARNQELPSLDAVVSYDRYGLAGDRTVNASNLAGVEGGLGDSFSNIGNGDFYDARVGVALTFPIGNRAARGSAAVARNTLTQSEADLVRVRKIVRAQVLDAVAALTTATQRVEAARAGLEAARVQLSSEQDRYDVGLSTSFLVLTRQNDLAQARLDEISALTDYEAARTEVARATGTLLTDRGIDQD